MMPTYTDTIRMLSPPKRGYGPSPRKGESAPPCCLGGLPAAPPPPLPPLPPPPPRAGRPPAAGGGIGLARRDGEVGNAEGADVIGHDADLRTGRGFIPDVADLLAVDDEARRAGHQPRGCGRSHPAWPHSARGDVAALVALQAEQERVLVGRQFKQAQALVGAVVQHHADRSLGIRRLDHHIHVGHSARLRRRPDVHIQRLFAARRRSVAQREPAILHASGPALQHLLLDRAGQRPSCCWYWARAGVLKAPTMESRAMPRRRIRSL